MLKSFKQFITERKRTQDLNAEAQHWEQLGQDDGNGSTFDEFDYVMMKRAEEILARNEPPIPWEDVKRDLKL